MTDSITHAELPPRIVHLPGGLRALDDRSEWVTIQLAANAQLVRFPTPPYPELYSVLNSRGLHPIGVEFVNMSSYRRESAPDWQCCAPSSGFVLRTERNAWANIKHAALQDHNSAAADAAGRCKTYLDLLSIRVFQLSNAYNQMLMAWHSGGGVVGHLIDNTFMPYIDAAVHAFVSDASSFRDLVAEIVWRFVLKETAPLTTLSSFLKKARASLHPLAVEIVNAGASDGWMA